MYSIEGLYTFYRIYILEYQVQDNKYYVYELIDPRTEKPFYVGKGSGERINNYFKDYPKVNQHTRVILEEIALSGKSLQLNIVSESLSEIDAIDTEKILIKKYGRLLKEPGGLLTNIKASGFVQSTPSVKKGKYTTVQVRKEMYDTIRKFCMDSGLEISSITEKLWKLHISSSNSL
jgi:hypothetical protein